MGFIRVAKGKLGFEDATTGVPFVPVGSNYCGVMAALSEGGYCGSEFPLFGHDEYTEKDGVAEGIRALERMAALNLNVVRIWLEPDEFFPYGRRLDPIGAAKLDTLLDAGRSLGIRFSLGLHLTPIPSGWKLHSHEPPHNERLLEMLYLLGRRWGQNEDVFSWTIVGEGFLPWESHWLREKWGPFLQYWYNDNLEALKKAWGNTGVDFHSFMDAPVPPRNIGYQLGLGSVNPGNLDKLPFDQWAGSTWRYDWRLFLEEIGSSRVHQEAKVLRDAGVKQMITVGNNSWLFPNMPCGQMALGYNPYFYLDSVDYLCQHHYPAPQCLPGGNGDPLSSEEALQSWLNAVDVMGRTYTSLGKPVVLEEWSWYGGGETAFLCKLPFRTLEEQTIYCERMMETTQHTYSGWFYWMWRDQPKATDLTNFSGLYAKDGNTLKPWGKRYGEWAKKLQAAPPVVKPATKVVDMPMKDLYTSDREHENWLQQQMHEYHRHGPYDFNPVFERKPLTTVCTDLTLSTVTRTGPIETPMGVREDG